MRTLYFDCFAGISGDMTLGALVDAGADARELTERLSLLGVEGYEISFEKADRSGISATRAVVRLTRKNLMLRDQFQCQYCGKRPSQRDLNVDHVMPRSRGGQDSWENLVVSCRFCNLKKGRRTPQEASMTLLRPPLRPRWSTATQILLVARTPYEEWDPFLKAG